MNSFRHLRAVLMLLVSVTCLSCGGTTQPGVGATGDPPVERPATGELRLNLALAVGDLFDVVALKLKVSGPTFSDEVVQDLQDFEDQGLPATIDPRLAGHRFADVLMVVPPGDYVIEAIPLRSKAPEESSANCGIASATVTVRPARTSEVLLVSQCSAATGALDTTVTFNAAPTIQSVEIPGGKYLCSDRAAAIHATVDDADGDPIAWSWKVKASDDLCLSQRGPDATFSAIKPGKYEVTLEVRDNKGGQGVLTFPLYVSSCDDQVLEPVCPGVAVSKVLSAMPAPGESVGRCDCGNDPDKPFDPPYLLKPRSAMLTRLVTPNGPDAPTAAGGWCDLPPDSPWQGTFLKARKACAPGTDECGPSYEVDCGYEFVAGGTPRYQTINAIPHTSLWLDQPILGLTASGGSGLPYGVWTILRARYLTKIAFQDPNGFLEAGQTLTRVAVIDSAALEYSNVKDFDTYGHGRAVGRIIADLSCNAKDAPREPERCGQSIRNYLALDRVANGDKDTTNGGFFGDLVSLDRAINRALDEWVASSKTAPAALAPLVINISAGWDGRHLDRPPSETEVGLGAGTQAALAERIKVTLQRASCLGALVVAAAGNGDIPSEDQGPLYPAAWETTDAPGDAACRRWGPSYVPPADGRWLWGVGHRQSGSVSCRPLVYAISGVGDDNGRSGIILNATAALPVSDLLLSTTRTKGVSRLAGQALAVVTSDVRGMVGQTPSSTLVLTGSSMAAATVSGIAAALWSRAPGLDAHLLMSKYVSLSGDPAIDGVTQAPVRPDFAGTNCLDPMGNAFSRVANHCRAIRALAPNSGPPCPSTAFSSPSTPLWVPDVSQSRAVDFDPGFSSFSQLLNPGPVFGASHAPWVEAYRLVNPQPGSPTCGSVCFFDTWDNNSFKGSFGIPSPNVVINSSILVPTFTGYRGAKIFGPDALRIPQLFEEFAVPVLNLDPIPARTGIMATSVYDTVETILHTESFLVW